MFSIAALRTVAVWVVVTVILAPILVLFAQGGAQIASNYWETEVAWMTVNTLSLALGTVVLASVWGVGSAWLVEICQFPGRKWFAFALFLPFAVPPYLLAFVWADMVDDGGWLPTGWGVRNLAGACLVMSLVLYPYVYMFARSSFAQRSCSLLSASRLLGCTPWESFLRIALPVARPAIAVGGLLVFMETANDIAVAGDYGIRTLGYHVYDLWLNRNERGAAAGISILLVIMALVLAMGEAASRRRQRQYQQGVRCYCSDYSYQLTGAKCVLALSWCVLLFSFAFAIPVLFLATKVIHTTPAILNDMLQATSDSLFIAFGVVLLGFSLGVLLAYMRKSGGDLVTKGITRFAMLGYAFPGVIYALGIILVVSAGADWAEERLGLSLHWLWISSVSVLVAALSCRFVAITWGAIEAGLGHVSPLLVAVARNAGKGWLTTLLTAYLPVMRPALLAGLLLLMVDVLKELPLTLILRPFGTDTLALQVFQHAADEDLGSAAPAALMMVALASLALLLAYRWLVPAWVKPEN